MSTREPDNEHGDELLTPIFPFTQLGEAVELYSGLIGGLDEGLLEGTIRLVPFPRPDIRWEVALPDTGEPLLAMDRVGDYLDLTAGGMAGRGMINSASFDAVGGGSSGLEFESGELLDRVLVQWMNLPDYAGNMPLRHVSPHGRSWTRGRLAVEVDGWKIVLDGRLDLGALFKDDAGLARYAHTHVMELRRIDGASFEVESARQIVEALRLSLSFAAGRWVAPTIHAGWDSLGAEAWRWWRSPICAPYTSIGSPVISPRVAADLEAFLKASVPKLQANGADNTTGFQMKLATQTSDLGFVENRIFSTFPAIENLSWETFVLGNLVSKREFKERWSASRCLRELLTRAQIPVEVEKERLPALHQLAAERGGGPEAVIWVRNELIHPKDPYGNLYARESLVVEAWQQSREYICLLLLHTIGYTGGYLSTLPPYGSLGGPARVPWVPT